MEHRFFSLISGTLPAGFASTCIGKRELLATPVVLLVPDCETACALLPDFRSRVEGIILTTGEPQSERIGRLLWHIVLPPENLDHARTTLSAMLDAIAVASEKCNEAALATMAEERLREENEAHLHDYLRVKSALQIQVSFATASEDKLTTILDAVDSFIYLKDTESRYLFANRSLRDFLHESGSDLVGAGDDQYFNAATAAAIRLNDRRALESGESLKTEEIVTMHGSGQTSVLLSARLPLRNEDGSIYALCGVSTDITERKLMEEQIRHLAFFDTLTDLPNRRLLNDRLGQAMAAIKRNGNHGALMFIDLDNFKPLNDTHGHAAGDLLLVEAAGRIKACVRNMDTVARFGGDEFVVMVPELDRDRGKSKSQAIHIAEKLRSALSETYMIDLTSGGSGKATEVQHRCSASIGIALFSHETDSADDILKWADAAMYRAKEAGRNTVCLHESDA